MKLVSKFPDYTYFYVTGTGTKVFVFPNGVVPCNEKIIKIVNILKPEVRTLVEKCNTVRMWVTLLIPKIEDGNNFGVSIQVMQCFSLIRTSIYIVFVIIVATAFA